ncbi:hypothetical protein LBMAG55_17180 [Verrucomicrobiota bacterium]|nr:hypothetical protein LBMAG55_17180 [Verrucomicrobiota bacterium]
MSNEESQPSPETVEQRRQLSVDATLGLERLVVGRECNRFDRLSAERKSLAFAELIRLGLVYGTVKPVEGRAYPDVVIQRVSRNAAKNVRKLRLSTDRPDRRHLGWNLFLIGLFLAIAGLVLWAFLK